jgi:RNA polymerase sigma-70 factor (ECF subfamily)
LVTERSDEVLMLAFKRGEVRAFELLVARHRGPVFNFILRYVGQRPRAEDLLQETWLKVVRSAKDYEPKARFSTWVYTLARNLCVDASRKESYRQAASLDVADLDDGAPLSERLPAAGVSAERGAHNARLRPLLMKALANLPPDQREVFLLREYQGMPFKDIAEVVGAGEPTVKSRMRYALEGLRKALEALGVDGDLAEGEEVAAG